MKFDLSVLIPARNEMFLSNTIDSVLANSSDRTEVIVVADGAWPNPVLKDHPRVTLIHNTVPVGQRAAVNQAARLSTAKFIMKLDAHCAVDKDFDLKLMSNIKYNWTVVPRLYNLHVFNWKCRACGLEKYQGPTPSKCEKCGSADVFRDMIYQPRWNRRSDFMRFDKDLHFQYWKAYEKRPESKGDIADVMGNLGACFFMYRERYWDLGGMDENHGSWGQMGTEVSCKAWLSGGRQVVNKTSWYSHLFRTQGGDFGFPYPNPQSNIDKARAYSKDLWLNGKWPLACRKIDWILDKFGPVPGWEV
jgi:glycosyltransferase involved in cell wall biosynthesis